MDTQHHALLDSAVYPCRCTLRAAVAAWKSKEDVQRSSPSESTAATAATADTATASGEAEEVASLPGTAQVMDLKAPCTQLDAAAASPATAAGSAEPSEEAQLSGGAPNSPEDTSNEADCPTAAASETQDADGAGAPAVAQAATPSAAPSEVQDTQGVASQSDAFDRAAVLPDAATKVQDDEGLAASASTPSASHTAAAAAAAAAAEGGPTGAQLRSRGIVEGLLRSRAPWPDMDFEGLVRDAGKKLQHRGLMS